ncbi:MAG: RNA polymerase sigma factor, partial [Sphingobacteriales bacterium]
FRKITAVLCRLFGIEHISIAEDIVGDTFLLAAETWGLKGIPQNPAAWLYVVAKNKTRDFLKRSTIFNEKVSLEVQYTSDDSHEIEVDLSTTNINDSQLQMMFTICYPRIPPESQIGLSLRILCSFSIDEIADAFLTNKETINKRLYRAKEKLKQDKVKIEMPPDGEIGKRIENVLTTLYLLFNEGYYSSNRNTVLTKDLCLEAMRLTHMLTENESTDKPEVNALLALMCFHASRFNARIDKNGELILYGDQDISLWNKELIKQGEYLLNRAAQGDTLSRYHIEAAIAYWHTVERDSPEKWEKVLSLYNRLLMVEYSPIAALNRTYALAKVYGNETAIVEAEKLGLDQSHLYHILLGELYSDADKRKAIEHFVIAAKLTKTSADRNVIRKKIDKLK